jgi:hypothetical protein
MDSNSQGAIYAAKGVELPCDNSDCSDWNENYSRYRIEVVNVKSAWILLDVKELRRPNGRIFQVYKIVNYVRDQCS